MATEFDIIILGGGCAGLSLVMRLAKLGQDCPRVAMIEKREQYVADRTWSYWASQSAELKHLARAEWKQVAINGDGKNLRIDCADVPYQAIDAGAFYDAAVAEIVGNPNILFYRGDEVKAVCKVNGLWEVGLSRGTLSGRQVVDTRPVHDVGCAVPLMWQSFSGVEVECAEDIFDDGVATLMDFIQGPEGQVTFLYVLPYTPSRALIEVTVFGREVRSERDLAPILDESVKKWVKSVSVKVTYREHYAIPMGLPERERSKDESYVRAGIEAGGARAATGYVFQRIQRWAEESSERVRSGRMVRGHARDPWLVRKMDRLFLRVLLRNPERGPELFVRLFGLRDPRSVMRFMHDEATMLDYLKIMCALPKRLFLAELAKGFFR